MEGDGDMIYPYMPYGRWPDRDEIGQKVKRCGLTHKQWEKKKRERKNKKKARKRRK